MNPIEILLWIGITCLLIGYIFDFKKHIFRFLGYASIGIFWVGEAPYFLEINDYVNAGLCLLALPLFLYFSYNEFLSLKWEEDPDVMKFLAGGISIAMLIYFGVQRVPILAGGLINIVAHLTTWTSNLLGYNFTTGTVHYVGNPLYYRVNHGNIFVPIRGSGINLILACTALQTLAPAASLIYCTIAPMKPKVKSLLLVLPTIFFANIGRNVLVIYLYNEGITSFEVAHNQIAKTGSVILLIILLMIVFEMMPEFHDNIMSVLNLPKREPIHRKQH